ncbi:MAG: hypothetical protein K2X00_24105 [Nitrospiraceae bacterium]|nr:hypothetical protein [Nitrospiraceae bacterium]
MSDIEEYIDAALSGGLVAQNGYMPRSGRVWLREGAVDVRLLAKSLVAGLGLTQEWGALHEGDTEPDSWMDDRDWAQKQVSERCLSCDHCRNALPKKLVSRFVSRWEEQG